MKNLDEDSATEKYVGINQSHYVLEEFQGNVFRQNVKDGREDFH